MRDASGNRWGKVEREFFIDNLLVRIHFIIVMIRWTGLAPWEFEAGSLTSTFLGKVDAAFTENPAPSRRCRANSPHVRQSRPGSGLSFQVKVLNTF